MPTICDVWESAATILFCVRRSKLKLKSSVVLKEKVKKKGIFFKEKQNLVFF